MPVELKSNLEGLYFAMPINTNKYHIFREGRSLCARWAMFGKNESLSTDITGKEKLGRDDCKGCFKKLMELIK